MKILQYIFAALCFALTGCESALEKQAADEEYEKRNETNFRNPKVAGTLPDGREISVVKFESRSNYDHYIYFIDKEASISNNHDVQVGKTKRHEVQVMIDGVKFSPAEKE